MDAGLLGEDGLWDGILGRDVAPAVGDDDGQVWYVTTHASAAGHLIGAQLINGLLCIGASSTEGDHIDGLKTQREEIYFLC